MTLQPAARGRIPWRRRLAHHPVSLAVLALLYPFALALVLVAAYPVAESLLKAGPLFWLAAAVVGAGALAVATVRRWRRLGRGKRRLWLPIAGALGAALTPIVLFVTWFGLTFTLEFDLGPGFTLGWGGC